MNWKKELYEFHQVIVFFALVAAGVWFFWSFTAALITAFVLAGLVVWMIISDHRRYERLEREEEEKVQREAAEWAKHHSTEAQERRKREEEERDRPRIAFIQELESEFRDAIEKELP